MQTLTSDGRHHPEGAVQDAAEAPWLVRRPPEGDVRLRGPVDFTRVEGHCPAEELP